MALSLSDEAQTQRWSVERVGAPTTLRLAQLLCLLLAALLLLLRKIALFHLRRGRVFRRLCASGGVLNEWGCTPAGEESNGQ